MVKNYQSLRNNKARLSGLRQNYKILVQSALTGLASTPQRKVAGCLKIQFSNFQSAASYCKKY